MHLPDAYAVRKYFSHQEDESSVWALSDKEVEHAVWLASHSPIVREALWLEIVNYVQVVYEDGATYKSTVQRGKWEMVWYGGNSVEVLCLGKPVEVITFVSDPGDTLDLEASLTNWLAGASKQMLDSLEADASTEIAEHGHGRER